jgi:HAD superfamily hydrolase (TIGR01457 family)
MMDLEGLSVVRGFLIDLDGTTYLGDHLLPGARRFIELLQKRELKFLFLTNNSSRSNREYGEKLRALGLNIIDDQIFTSGEATAKYLSKLQPGARVFVVGTPALEDEFIEHGFELIAEDPEFIVLGFDTSLSYQKLWQLCDFVRDGVPYIATHPDLNCPVQDGYMPDIGATITFVEASTGRKPDTVVGKPNKSLVEAVEARMDLSASELCMVGDRLYTDIALGQHGVRTVMVLSGETSLADLQDSPIQPDVVVESLADLASLLQKAAKGF